MNGRKKKAQKLIKRRSEFVSSCHLLQCSAVRWQLPRHCHSEQVLSVWGNAIRDWNELLYPKCTIPLFLFVLISYSLTSHKFKLGLCIQIIPQDLYMKFGVKWSNLYTFSTSHSINRSTAPVLSKYLASFSVNTDFFISSELAWFAVWGGVLLMPRAGMSSPLCPGQLCSPGNGTQRQVPRACWLTAREGNF